MSDEKTGAADRMLKRRRQNWCLGVFTIRHVSAKKLDFSSDPALAGRFLNSESLSLLDGAMLTNGRRCSCCTLCHMSVSLPLV